VKPDITLKEFQSLDIRAGTVVEASPAKGVKVPAYLLKIDFGEIGLKSSSAQLTDHYSTEDLIGRQILAVVNFPPKQIGKIMSEVLVLGGYESDGTVRLLKPDREVENGARLN